MMSSKKNLKDDPLYWDLPSLGGPSSAVAYGRREPDLRYDYVDRLSIWYERDERESARAVADDKYGKVNTVHWWEAYLSHLYGVKVDIRHIILDRHSDGYTYQTIGYRVIDKPQI